VSENDAKSIANDLSELSDPSINDHSVNDIILVHGVFGSGKSHLLASVCVFIKRLSALCSPPIPTSSSHPSALKRGVKRDRIEPSRVTCLLSANTNVAVDRVMVQLAIPNSAKNDEDEGYDNSDGNKEISLWPQIARVGCAAKIDRNLRKHLVLQAENKITTLKELTRLRETDSDPQLKKLAEDTKKPNFAELQANMIKEADVIGVTCASAINTMLKAIQCHVLILDECSQMTEPLSLLPMACARPLKMLLVGDPKQLPPTMASSTTSFECGVNTNDSTGAIVSGKANAKETYASLSRTLFDRLLAIGWGSVTLRTQYRCHPVIAQVCSDLFYNGELLHGISAIDQPPLIPYKIPFFVQVKKKHNNH
jgi:superfamily I DNA and/or RNA helicase